MLLIKLAATAGTNLAQGWTPEMCPPEGVWVNVIQVEKTKRPEKQRIVLIQE